MSTSNAPTFLAIAGIFKNEAPYILEWIAHHRLLGIHRFFIADNDSTDISTELFEALARLGHVELIRHTTEPGIKPQIPAYQRLVELAGDRVRWMAFIDADEFIWPTSPGPGIEDFIRTLDAQGDVGALALNWATYGSGRNYFYENAPVQQRFQHCASPPHWLNQNIKSIVKLQALDRFASVHGVFLKPPYCCVMSDGHELVESAEYTRKETGRLTHSDRVCWDSFRVNHYIVKSWLEFSKRKIPRGRAYTDSAALTKSFFLGHDNNDCPQPMPEAHLRALADEIQRLRDQLQGIGFALDRLDLACSAAELNANPFTGPIEGCIDGLTLNAEGLRISGWGLAWRESALRGLRVQVNQQDVPLSHFVALARPDVQTHYAKAPVNSGFNALCAREHLPQTIHTVTIHGLAEEGFSEPIEFGKYVDIPGLAHPVLRDHT
ncbi:glycosyltransferase family 2 protein [Hydrogenophaga sp.]|uniref:glycosyltransferase family 2 protein n=1 Tax=Hydrogenophaga sp. TaxID=1904254 RepID=UPI0008B075C7|nr:glycosyltransferase family 2 protein [Hydrogenophaga sp.]OGA76572.1 MAG: hypothetical protein A2X73_19925 [Burkholderiales bacterium GWE1_65_30]OGA91488.1 MAG: hypothetical protein A2X72_04830 [Burkholderiales bacterium GWF1_66_17]